MRIGIVNTQTPFMTGGAERHAATLCKAFRERGFDATEVSIPFKWYPASTLVDHILAAKLVDLGELENTPIDLMVGLKFPAYLARHPEKVYWVLHQHRAAYDMWESGLSYMLHDPEGAGVRALIHEEDRLALGAARGTVYANSRNVADRMMRYNGIASTPLYHPPPQAEKMRRGDYGDYLFAPSRMNPVKRQSLMLDALALSTRETRIVFAGPPDDPAYLDVLKAKARELGVEDRATFLGAVDDATMLRHYAECRGVVFVPVDEDYGYITLEAMLSARPVVTVTDSGGALEFVADGVEGFVTAPEAPALARAFDALSGDAALAERMGTAALARYRAMDIGWDNVVATLTKGRGTGSSDALAPDPAALLRAPTRATFIDGNKAEEASPDLVPPAEDMALETVDIEALKALIAPDPVGDPPFSSIAEVRRAYDFDTCSTGEEADPEAVSEYLETHWQRYLATLKLVLAGRTDRVLDVGISPPFLFQAMLVAARPGTRIDGIRQGSEPFAQKVTARRDDLEDFDIALAPANAERDPLPYPDSTFDLVTGMEILEHFAIDPLFFAAEAARVLRPGGRIVLTTPNAVSHRGMRKMLDGASPYSFGIYVPSHGAYGRHNREFTPHEVARLCEAAGFETETLRTADVYDDRIDPEVARLLGERGGFELRGETILYVGRLDAHRPPDLPADLYHGDPRAMSGALRVAHRDTETGRTRIEATNTSSVLWSISGPRAMFLDLKWYEGFGDLVHEGVRVPLAEPLAPGATGETVLHLPPGIPDASHGTIGIEFYIAESGAMTGAGRSGTLRLPCSEAAFLRIARGET